MIRTIGLSLIVALFFTACGPTTRPLSELEQMSSRSETYLVKSGDNLSVQVWGEPDVSREVFVRADGKFTLPLINDVFAEGKTLEEITAAVTEKLKQFIPQASVSTSVVQSASVRYYLSGQFVKPGEYQSARRITLLQAIATGGGFAPFADTGNIMLIRKVAATEYRYELDYDEVIVGGQPNPTLIDGDIIAAK